MWHVSRASRGVRRLTRTLRPSSQTPCRTHRQCHASHITHTHTHTHTQITEPYLQIYRGILPPLFGQLDFTPLFGFLILQVRAVRVVRECVCVCLWLCCCCLQNTHTHTRTHTHSGRRGGMVPTAVAQRPVCALMCGVRPHHLPPPARTQRTRTRALGLAAQTSARCWSHHRTWWR
jgi:hypothetical protein